MLEPMLSQLNEMRVVLASSSKQRAALLASTKLKFEICPSNFEENLDPREHTFSDFVEKTAVGKLNDVYDHLKNDKRKPDIIIGVDTMVTCNGKMYGKPKTTEEAINTITVLTQSGIPNSVYSGVAIRYKDKIHKFTEVTTVHMAKLDNKEILAYVETGEPIADGTAWSPRNRDVICNQHFIGQIKSNNPQNPSYVPTIFPSIYKRRYPNESQVQRRGKAGGYGIQGIASTFVTRIEGDGNNVIGLPLCRLVQELKQLLNHT